MVLHAPSHIPARWKFHSVQLAPTNRLCCRLRAGMQEFRGPSERISVMQLFLVHISVYLVFPISINQPARAFGSER